VQDTFDLSNLNRLVTDKFDEPFLKPKPKPENVENHSQKPKP